jgi:hypothetical protein
MANAIGALKKRRFLKLEHDLVIATGEETQ